MGSSNIFRKTLTVNAATISANTDILTSDYDVTVDDVAPGGGAIMRIYFSLIFTGGTAVMTVYNNGVIKGTLNVDAPGGTVSSDGIYRFDIDVENGDALNLRASADITTVRYVRFHLIQWGA